ncbi:BspA family leucine-rich repeat surface protein, partial [Rhodohalobacter halophilus]|uniref:BspA family leucine-rich repeat surface protein n=1 Tax=Rhodohalobacter halophilus TaxID=1812810 RepID=UPI000B06DA3D
QDIGNWDVSSAEDMTRMFWGASSFNQNLRNWCVEKIASEPDRFSSGSDLQDDYHPVWGTCPSNAFYLAENAVTVKCTEAGVGDYGWVNGVEYTKRTSEMITPENASTTCTSGIVDMNAMFRGETDFNEDIRHWDVSSVTSMAHMFSRANSFNQDIGSWDVSNVTEMRSMFREMSFDQDISDWEVGNVTDMSWMFYLSDSFNQDIGDWDVSSVENMESMFWNANSFNQDVGRWDVSAVTDMTRMFYGANVFNQDLTNWCVENIDSEPSDFASGSPLQESYKPIWGTCPGE